MSQLQQPVVQWNTDMDDKQAILDKVVRHLASMGKRSYEEGKCKYRTADGNKCAVGCLFEGYDPVLEVDPILLHLISDGYVPAVPYRTMKLLTDLQYCHDNYRSWGPDALSDFGWESLDNIADTHGLTMPDLEVPEV
jgi:hypothetical protein